MADFVTHYNDHRLHSAIGYVTPRDMLEGRQEAIHAERDRKLELAREERARNRAKQRNVRYDESTRPEIGNAGKPPERRVDVEGKWCGRRKQPVYGVHPFNLPLTCL